MKKTIISILTLVLVLYLSGIGWADLVDISVTTDKTTYLVGEEVKVFISAYNPGTDPVTLTFASDIQASYWMDETYDWQAGRYRLDMLTYATINPNTTHTWELTHASYEMSVYTLGIGMHEVVGEVLAFELGVNSKSEPVEFEVIPEPASLFLLTTGCVYLSHRKNATAKRIQFMLPRKPLEFNNL